jgi:hypothetical protein
LFISLSGIAVVLLVLGRVAKRLVVGGEPAAIMMRLLILWKFLNVIVRVL